jgi:hypothetical protein
LILKNELERKSLGTVENAMITAFISKPLAPNEEEIELLKIPKYEDKELNRRKTLKNLELLINPNAI